MYLAQLAYNGIYFPLDYIQSTFICNERSQAKKATVTSTLTFVFSNVGWVLDGLAIVRPRALFGDWVGFKGVGKYSKYQISKLDVLNSISYNGIYFPLDYIQSVCSHAMTGARLKKLLWHLRGTSWSVVLVALVAIVRPRAPFKVG